MALPGKHPSEAPYPLLLVNLAIFFGVPGTPSSWFHLCQIYMVHLSKKFGQKDFFDKIFINWVDTARLIPCSAKNCLNTFSNKLAKHVREERDIGKGMSEERECVPPGRIRPAVSERSIQQAKNLASIDNPESDRQEVEVACVCCVFGE